MTHLLRDRTAAGQRLVARLTAYADRPDALVLALPRGGVPVGAEVARALRLPLDVLLARKLPAPGAPELALGAIGADGETVLNDQAIRSLRVPISAVEAAAARELRELQRREQAYRDGSPALDPAGKIAIIVDDGLATGATMLAAIAWLRKKRPVRIVVAVPVSSLEGFYAVSEAADQVECLAAREPFYSIGQWYGDFRQLGDDEVREVLRQAKYWVPAAC